MNWTKVREILVAIGQYNKAIVAVVPTILISVNTLFGTSLNLNSDQINSINTLLGIAIPALVWLVPNTKKENGST